MNANDGGFGSHTSVFPTVDFSTRSVDESLRSDVWRRLTAPFFEVTVADTQQHAVFEGGITAHVLGRSLVGAAWFNAQRRERNQQLVLSTSLDQYLVQLFLEGAGSVFCVEREVHVQVGDILVLDLAKTSSHFAPRGGNTIWMVVPHTVLDRETRGCNLHGVVVRSSDPLASLLCEILTGLHRHGNFTNTDDACAVEDAAISLLAGAIIRNRGYLALSAPALSIVLRRHILTYVDEHLTSPQLGVEYLVTHFNVSRAHLYRIFSEDGGVAAMIRDRRLDAAYRDLTRGGGHPAGVITEVAHKYLFSSSNHFLRAFRVRFSCSPSDAVHMGAGVQVENSANGIFGYLSDVVASLGLPA